MSKKDMDLINQFASIIANKYNLDQNDLIETWNNASKEYIKLSKIELQNLCKEKGLKVSGTKTDLMLRLQGGEVEVKKTTKKKHIPLILQKILHHAPKINVKRNQHGNYEDPDTHLCFSESSMKVIGKQLDDGTMGELSEEDKLLCDRNMFEY